MIEKPGFITRLDFSTLPGIPAQYLMAPPGRPPVDPSSFFSTARKAAVLILMHGKQKPCVLLLKRSDGTGIHAGQISFPGGSLEHGEDFVEAALRETREETGLEIKRDAVLGQLSPLYIPPSNFYVSPVVAWIPETGPLALHPSEAAYALKPSLNSLLTARSKQNIMVRGTTLENIPGFNVGEDWIWGATAMILSELLTAMFPDQWVDM